MPSFLSRKYLPVVCCSGRAFRKSRCSNVCRYKEVDAAPAFSVAIYKLDKIPGLLMSEARCAQENPKLSTKEMGEGDCLATSHVEDFYRRCSPWIFQGWN